MPRFAVLEHDHPFLHWDLLLEVGASLRTWRLHSPPDSGGEIVAEPLPDHRPIYLDYEGPVSGDRGFVSQWDAGDFEWIEDAGRQQTVELHGRVLSGTARLTATSEGRWTFQATRSER